MRSRRSRISNAALAFQMAKRGRDAISLPPLPMKFREALGDYLKVQPEPKEPNRIRKARKQAKRKAR